DVLARRFDQSRPFRSHPVTTGLWRLELQIIIRKNKHEPRPPRTNRLLPAARSRWRHMIEPSLLTSRRLALLTLRLRSVISLACRRAIRSLYGLDFTKTTRKPASIVTKMFSLR